MHQEARPVAETKMEQKDHDRERQAEFFIHKVSMYNTGSKYNYTSERETTFESNNSFPGYKVSTRNVKLSHDQNAAYLKLLKRVKKESQRQRNAKAEGFIVNTHPNRDNDNVTPKIARVAKNVV